MYLGLDIGTSSVKGLLLDKDREIITSVSAPLVVGRPHEGWSEQDPQEWCDAIEDVMAQLSDRARDTLRDIVSIGLSGQMHGMVALDGAGDVLRPAILWNDIRNGSEAKELDSVTNDFRKIGGNAVMPGFTAPKALWTARHEPEIFAQIKTILLPKDYVRYWLSGEMISDMSDSSGTLWLDVGARDYSDKLLSYCGLSRDHLPALAEGVDVAGSLRPELAAKWGIAGRPVLAGAGDNAAAACGLGVVSPGDGFLSLGTSGVVFVVSDNFAPAADSGAHAFCHALPNIWHQMGVILSATDSLNWLSEITNQSIDKLAEAAAMRDVGTASLFFHPYLSGERTPHNDASARGSFVGLSRSHDIADMAFAVLEGVAFALGDCVDVLIQAGSDLSSLIATGGGANNDQWLQMIADVTNCKITVPVAGDYGAALGAARLGAIATGCDKDEILQKPDCKASFAPNQSAHEVYAKRRQRWQALYHTLAESQ